jgi:zinc protease
MEVPIVSLRTTLTLAPALALLLAAALPASAEPIFPFPVHRATLDNGLQVIVVPYASPGVVAYYTVVRTGSRDEVEDGHSGFAHFFEHMMFRGTERYPKEKYGELLKRMGADSNAFTSDDQTVYYIVGPASELEQMMDMEADRFQNLKYGEEAFRTEALAVLGEYNKNVSSPFLPMNEKLRDLAFSRHTYKHTTIGFLADIQAMPGYYQYSLGFFDRYYRPENVSLVVVGDVDPEATVVRARAHYGAWRRGYRPPAVEDEPPQAVRKSDEIAWPNPIRPHLMLGYHIPGFSTATVDTAALDLVEQLLFSDTAPLYQELVVEKQWVDFIQGGAPARRDPHLFSIVARVKSAELVPQVKAAIDRHVQKLQSEPVAADRLERIKSHLRYAFALSLSTPGEVAGQVAQAVSLTGDPGALNALYAQYQRVTPADVERLAREVFRPQNETQVTLQSAAKAAAGSQGGAR